MTSILNKLKKSKGNPDDELFFIEEKLDKLFRLYNDRLLENNYYKKVIDNTFKTLPNGSEFFLCRKILTEIIDKIKNCLITSDGFIPHFEGKRTFSELDQDASLFNQFVHYQTCFKLILENINSLDYDLYNNLKLLNNINYNYYNITESEKKYLIDNYFKIIQLYFNFKLNPFIIKQLDYLRKINNCFKKQFPKGDFLSRDKFKLFDNQIKNEKLYAFDIIKNFKKLDRTAFLNERTEIIKNSKPTELGFFSKIPQEKIELTRFKLEDKNIVSKTYVIITKQENYTYTSTT